MATPRVATIDSVASCDQGIPRPLGLVEHHDMIVGRSGVAERVVAKVVEVLNEGPDGVAGGADAGRRVGAPRAVEVVAGQGLPQHRHQRAVAGEEHRVGPTWATS